MKRYTLILLSFFGFTISYSQALKLPEGGEYFEWRKGANKHTLGYTGMTLAYIQKCNPNRDSLIKTGLLQFNKMQFLDTCIFGKQQIVMVDSLWKETKVTFFNKKSAETYLAILQQKNEVDIRTEKINNSTVYYWRTKAVTPRFFVIHKLVMKKSKPYYYAYAVKAGGVRNPSF